MLNFLTKTKQTSKVDSGAYGPLNFIDIEKRSYALADLIERRGDKLIDILLRYESYEVAQDETFRALDLLRHIRENEQYFKLCIGPITSFLPRNQPLYALCCFVIVPSFMASGVYFRIPHTMKHFFREILELLKIAESFPNVHVSDKERLEFLKDRSALLKDPSTGETKPVTEAVIFTGTLKNAEKLRLLFDKSTLFISNGAGHNPVVVGKDANLTEAVKAVTSLQFYNQGQDCAAPNAILIHKDISHDFMTILRDQVKNTRIGEYHDKSTRIGPISEPRDLMRVQEFLVNHIKWIDASTPGVINTRKTIIAPTIIFKPLVEGGNFEEMFAPIIFVQEYESDHDLKHYFEHPSYTPNAMYLTLYGTSPYVQSLIGGKVGDQVLHDESTFIHNTHLHAQGVERGTKQYGGYGQGASSLSINGKIIAKPTLPQRDIFEQLVKPILDENRLDSGGDSRFTQIVHKNVGKLLQVKLTEQKTEREIVNSLGDIYLDTQQLQKTAARFLRVNREEMYHLLQEPNIPHITIMEARDIALIQKLLTLLEHKHGMSFEEFESELYALPKQEHNDNAKNRALQKNFFHNVYQLLFARSDGPRLAEFLWGIEEARINKLFVVADPQDE